MSNWNEPASAFYTTPSTTKFTVATKPIWPKVVSVITVSILVVSAFVLPATMVIVTMNKETITATTAGLINTTVTTVSTTTSTSITTATTSSTTSSTSTTTSSTSSTSTTSRTTTTSSTSTSTSTSSTSSTSTSTTTTTPCPSMLPTLLNYSTGSGSSPFGMTTGDLDGDNRPDVIFSSYSGSYVGVLLNSGTGTFPNVSTYSVGSSICPYWVIAYDVNYDGKLDIIVGYAVGVGFGVLLNSGTGTFPTISSYSTGTSINGLAVGDVNNDGRVDIIVPNYSTNDVGVLFNSGTGTFPSMTTYFTGSGTNPRSVALADINSDGQLDIVVTLYTTGSIGILLNSGNGTFPTIITYSIGSNIMNLAVVDLNSDSKADITITKTGSNNLAVLLNSGSGTFPTITNYATGSSTTPYNVAVTDIDSDGRPDLIVPNYSTNNVGVYLNAGSGTFSGQVTYSTGSGSSPTSAAVVDVNNDNKPDVIVANYGGNSISVHLRC